MKILYLLDEAQLYGSQIHLFDILKYFNNAINYQIKVIVFSDGDFIEILKNESISYKIIEIGWIPSKEKYFELKKEIKNFNPEIIHGHQPKAIFYGSLIAFTLKKKAINTIHSHPIDNKLATKGLIKKNIVYLFHYIIKYCSETLAVVNIYPSKAAQSSSFFYKKSRVVYNWLKTNYKTNEIINKRDILNQDKINLLSVGSITYKKGFDKVITFINSIQDIPHTLHILGEGDPILTNELKKIPSIEVHGYVKDTLPFYKSADLFVLFSSSETFGLVYIEAASMGLPIIALNLPVFDEILPEGNIIADNMIQVIEEFKNFISDNEKYKYISMENIIWVNNKFNYQKSMEELNNLYLETLI